MAAPSPRRRSTSTPPAAQPEAKTSRSSDAGLRLVLVESDGERHVVGRVEDRSAISLGRAPGNDVVLADATVSGRHARLVAAGAHLAVEDLGSTNGTFVDGSAVEPGERRVLHDGAALVLGRAELRVRLERSTAEPNGAAARSGSAAAAPRRGARTVLVAHDRADAPAAEAIVGRLRAGGHRVWIDRTPSPADDGWKGRLLDIVWSCDAAVFVVSPHSASSTRAQREVHLAGAEGVPVVPVLVDDVTLPEDLAYYLTVRASIDLRRDHMATGLEELAQAVGDLPRRRVTRPRRLIGIAVMAAAVLVVVAALGLALL